MRLSYLQSDRGLTSVGQVLALQRYKRNAPCLVCYLLVLQRSHGFANVQVVTSKTGCKEMKLLQM